MQVEFAVVARALHGRLDVDPLSATGYPALAARASMMPIRLGSFSTCAKKNTSSLAPL